MVALLKMPNRQSLNQSFTDRRMFPRRELHAQIAGLRLDHSIPARQEPHLNLELRDVSAGGLSVLTPMPLEAGEHISVYFPSNGRGAGWDACGRVVRCEPSMLGYRVAVEFDPLPAA